MIVYLVQQLQLEGWGVGSTRTTQLSSRLLQLLEWNISIAVCVCVCVCVCVKMRGSSVQRRVSPQLTMYVCAAASVSQPTNIGSLSVEVTMYGDASCVTAIPNGFAT